MRFLVVRDVVRLAFEGLPASEKRAFSIAYATRDGEGLRSLFSLWALHWSTDASWSHEEIAMPSVSSQLVALGSGTRHVMRWRDRWEATSAKRTSRTVFASFCDALRSGGDPLSGGPPQLVGLYRMGPGRTLGVVTRAGPHVFGIRVKIEVGEAHEETEWRNELFERVHGDGSLIPNAQTHHAPRGLGFPRARS